MLPRRLFITTALCLVAASTAHAQERQRSSSYSEAPQTCEIWDVGFEYRDCQRLTFPGPDAEYVQVYIKNDGSRVNHITDPQVSRLPEGSNRSAQAAPSNAQPQPPTVVVASPSRTQPPPQQPAAQQTLDRLPNNVLVYPGRTELLPVAVGHLNRLETPFATPSLRTSASDSAFNVEFDGNYVYVSVTEPVTMFLHEKGHPDPAIAVSLIPRQIAPRQVSLTLPAAQMSTIDRRRAQTVKTAQQPSPQPTLTRPGARYQSGVPHVSRAASVMQAFGQGEIPRGFRKGTGGFNGDGLCRTNVPGVRFSFRTGQKYYSSDYILLIGQATANSKVKLHEVWCSAHPATAAVSFYPRPIISKGKPTEVMVLLKNEQNKRKANTRTRLVSQ